MRFFIAKCYDYKCRRGTSGNEEAVHENCKYTRVVFSEALFHGCKVKYPNSGNAVMEVIGLNCTNFSWWAVFVNFCFEFVLKRIQSFVYWVKLHNPDQSMLCFAIKPYSSQEAPIPMILSPLSINKKPIKLPALFAHARNNVLVWRRATNYEEEGALWRSGIMIWRRVITFYCGLSHIYSDLPSFEYYPVANNLILYLVNKIWIKRRIDR